MPISKNGVPYYTDAKYDLARYESSALEYARATGYQLEKKGGWWTMKDHDSFVFAPNGMWFWNSRDMKGGAIEFLTQIEHKSLVDAVLTLAGERVNEKQNSIPFAKKQDKAEDKKPFELPPKADNFKRLFAYLCGARALDKEIVQDLVKQGKIYESTRDYKKDGETKSLHNAVFVGFDKDGQARSGFQRGLTSNVEHPFKRDVAGSEKEYAFCIEGKDTDTVAVFEASIDAISHAPIAKLSGQDYKAIDRIALGGIAFIALQHYLAAHTNVKNVVLCVDADQAGDKAAEDLKTDLINAGYTQENGYHCERQLPTGHKDFNEYLISYREALEEQHTAVQSEKQLDTQEEDGFFPEVEPEEECRE